MDLDAEGEPTGDTLRFLLDPDVPSQTPTGASITSAGVFTWTPTAGQVGTFKIVVIVVDQGTPPLADAETFTINVVAASQAPVVDLNGAAAGTGFTNTFTEDGGAVGVGDSSQLTVTDSDDTNLGAATVTLTNRPEGSLEVLAVDTTGTGITANYNSTTGVLSLTGSATVAQYQQVLRTLTYNNTSQNPTAGARTINVVVSDGDVSSAAAVSTITVVAVNDAPTVDLNGAAEGTNFEATFEEGEGPVVIVAPTMTIADVDDNQLQSATVSITNRQNGASEVLAVSVGSSSLVAVFNEATGVLTITGQATFAIYEEVLRTLTYDNTSSDPATTARTIEIVVNDGETPSVASTATVAITLANSAPNLIAIDDQNATVGEEIVIPVTVSDADEGDVLTFELDIDTPPEGMTIVKTGDTTAEIRWTPAAGDIGTVNIVVLVTDNGTPAKSDSESFAITVAAERPAVDLNGADAGTGFLVSYIEGDLPVPLAEPDVEITTTSSANIVSLTATITNLSDGAAEVLTAEGFEHTYASGVLTVTGSLTIAEYEAILASLAYSNTSADPTPGDRLIEIVVNDGTLDSLPVVSTVRILAINQFPNLTLPDPYDDTTTPAPIEVGHEVEFIVGVTDADHTAAEIIFQVDTDESGLPEGAALPVITNPGGTFSWTPTATGTFTFRILAVDAEGGVDQEEVTFTVVADTTAPQVATAPNAVLAAPITSLTIVFSEAMGLSATNPGNYTLVIVGGANNGQEVDITSVGTGDDKTLFLNLASALAIEDYRLTLDATKIKDKADNLLTGDTVHEFSVEAAELAFADLEL